MHTERFGTVAIKQQTARFLFLLKDAGCVVASLRAWDPTLIFIVVKFSLITASSGVSLMKTNASGTLTRLLKSLSKGQGN